MSDGPRETLACVWGSMTNVWAHAPLLFLCEERKVEGEKRRQPAIPLDSDFPTWLEKKNREQMTRSKSLASRRKRSSRGLTKVFFQSERDVCLPLSPSPVFFFAVCPSGSNYSFPVTVEHSWVQQASTFIHGEANKRSTCAHNHLHKRTYSSFRIASKIACYCMQKSFHGFQWSIAEIQTIDNDSNSSGFISIFLFVIQLKGERHCGG